MTDAELISRLIRDGIRVATVESCTGGLVAHRITEVPGSSATLWGSWVTYDDSAKIALGVSKETLKSHGAVSPETAIEMATTGFRLLEKALGNAISRVIATTGIAGPGGGSERVPVGLCYIGVAGSGVAPSAIEIHAPDGLDRSGKKRFFATEALAALAASLP